MSDGFTLTDASLISAISAVITTANLRVEMVGAFPPNHHLFPTDPDRRVNGTLAAAAYRQ